jgi:hypothetical protein
MNISALLLHSAGMADASELLSETIGSSPFCREWTTDARRIQDIISIVAVGGCRHAFIRETNSTAAKPLSTARCDNGILSIFFSWIRLLPNRSFARLLSPRGQRFIIDSYIFSTWSMTDHISGAKKLAADADPLMRCSCSAQRCLRCC